MQGSGDDSNTKCFLKELSQYAKTQHTLSKNDDISDGLKCSGRNVHTKEKHHPLLNGWGSSTVASQSLSLFWAHMSVRRAYCTVARIICTCCYSLLQWNQETMVVTECSVLELALQNAHIGWLNNTSTKDSCTSFSNRYLSVRLHFSYTFEFGILKLYCICRIR